MLFRRMARKSTGMERDPLYERLRLKKRGKNAEKDEFTFWRSLTPGGVPVRFFEGGSKLEYAGGGLPPNETARPGGRASS
jgi:hypothetical protein